MEGSLPQKPVNERPQQNALPTNPATPERQPIMPTRKPLDSVELQPPVGARIEWSLVPYPPVTVDYRSRLRVRHGRTRVG